MLHIFVFVVLGALMMLGALWLFSELDVLAFHRFFARDEE